MLSFYLYSISAISLAAFYFAALVTVDALARILFGSPVFPEAESARLSLAGGLGTAVVSFPLWALHWRWLRLQFTEAQGAAVTWHRFYLFTIVCLNALGLLIAGSLAVSHLARLALGLITEVETAASLGRAATGALLSAGLWWHHWRQFKGGPGELQPQPLASAESLPAGP